VDEYIHIFLTLRADRGDWQLVTLLFQGEEHPVLTTRETEEGSWNQTGWCGEEKAV
jgi:hypothetical protein